MDSKPARASSRTWGLPHPSGVPWPTPTNTAPSSFTRSSSSPCFACRAHGPFGRKFRFKNKLVSLDSTTIDLCVSLFDWAKFRRTKGAIKLHLLLDHDGYLPSYAVVTDGRRPMSRVARGLSFRARTIVVDDRGYTDYALRPVEPGRGLFRHPDEGERRLRRRRRSAGPQNRNVLKDQTILLRNLDKCSICSAGSRCGTRKSRKPSSS